MILITVPQNTFPSSRDRQQVKVEGHSAKVIGHSAKVKGHSVNHVIDVDSSNQTN